MKQGTSQALRDALYLSPGVSLAECWSFYLAGDAAPPSRWTSYGTDVTFDGVTWTSAGVGLRKGKLFARAGLSVDALELELFGTVTVGGASLVAAGCGLTFTGRRAVLQRVYFDAPGGTALGCVTIFDGVVQAVRPDGGRLLLEVRSVLGRTAQSRGTRLLQYTCPFSVYDPDCGVAPVDVPGQTGAGCGLTWITLSATFAPAPTIRAGDQITFTGGGLAGLAVLVQSVSGGQYNLASGLPSIPAAETTFTVRAGCAKDRAACRSLSNIARFGGAPDAPTKDIL